MFGDRLFLTYHTAEQVAWGAAIGALFGVTTYCVLELIPARYPQSSLGCMRVMLLSHPIATWLRLKDGWAVYEDGGHEAEWQEWRRRWEVNVRSKSKRE